VREECAVWQHFDSVTESGTLEFFILCGSVDAYFKTGLFNWLKQQ